MKNLGKKLSKIQLKTIYGGTDPNCLFACYRKCNVTELPGDKIKLFKCYESCRENVC